MGRPRSSGGSRPPDRLRSSLVSPEELERRNGRQRQCDRSWPRGLGPQRPPARARRRAARRKRRARADLRARPGDRRGRGRNRARALGRPRPRRHSTRRARSAHTPFLDASTADLHSRPWPRAARRRLGGGLRRRRRGAGARSRAGDDARPAALRSGRPRPHPLPRRCRDRVELPGHALPLGVPPVRGRGRAARGARPADDAHHRERLPADRPDRARRLVGGRGTPGRVARGPPGAGARVPRAGGGDDGMKITRTIAETRAALPAGQVGLVPTMGAYHAGHLSLFAAAREENDLVVASLFVNPAQFGDAADIARYPRDEAADAAIAEEAGIDVLFAPPADELYPAGYETWVDVTEASQGLEGAYRPDHFRGVATICLKLFNIVRPRRAYFGQKDAQQVEVVRRMIRDLNLDVELRVLPTVRDPDGLALSSRNALLSDDERSVALALPRALATRDLARARELLEDLDVDYVEVAPFDPPTLVAAVRVGSVRLIDNVPLEGGPA